MDGMGRRILRSMDERSESSWCLAGIGRGVKTSSCVATLHRPHPCVILTSVNVRCLLASLAATLWMLYTRKTPVKMLTEHILRLFKYDRSVYILKTRDGERSRVWSSLAGGRDEREKGSRGPWNSGNYR